MNVLFYNVSKVRYKKMCEKVQANVRTNMQEFIGKPIDDDTLNQIYRKISSNLEDITDDHYSIEYIKYSHGFSYESMTFYIVLKNNISSKKSTFYIGFFLR